MVDSQNKEIMGCITGDVIILLEEQDWTVVSGFLSKCFLTSENVLLSSRTFFFSVKTNSRLSP
jgi:hypothetical protein